MLFQDFGDGVLFGGGAHGVAEGGEAAEDVVVQASTSSYVGRQISSPDRTELYSRPA